MEDGAAAKRAAILEQLRAAIEARAPVSFEYAKAPGRRTGNPHALFLLRRKDGVETAKVDIAQTAGFSASGGPFPSWRRFDVDGIDLLEVHAELAPFEVSDVYNSEAEVYELSIARV